jgi:hypothetical protein
LYTTTHHGAKFEGHVIERRMPNAERRAERRTPNAEHPWLTPYDEGSPSGLQDLERVVAQQEGGTRKA